MGEPERVAEGEAADEKEGGLLLVPDGEMDTLVEVEAEAAPEALPEREPAKEKEEDGERSMEEKGVKVAETLGDAVVEGEARDEGVRTAVALAKEDGDCEALGEGEKGGEGVNCAEAEATEGDGTAEL